MKRIFLGLLMLASATGTFSSCKDSAKIPAPAEEDMPLILPHFAMGDKTTSYLDYFRARYSAQQLIDSGATRPSISFIIDPSMADKIRTVEVYKSFGTFNTSSLRNGFPNSYSNIYPRVKAAEFSTFPAMYKANSEEIAEGLTRAGAPVKPVSGVYQAFTPNAVIIFTFEYILKDGRRIILTPLDRRGAISGTFSYPPYALATSFATSFDALQIKPQY